jgi:putative ABC transport system substrate-binding protein
MTNRVLELSLALALLAAPLAAGAQPAKKVPQVGILAVGSAADAAAGLKLFWQGLRELGYVDGQNIRVEMRVAEGQMDRVPRLAAELVGLRVDVLVCSAAPGIAALKAATSTIPIVMAGASNAADRGFVASLARPGGNVTGLTSLSQELNAKRFELLKEAVPSLSRVAYLWEPATWGPYTPGALDAAVARLGIQFQVIDVQGPADLPRAFQEAVRQRAGALWDGNTPMTYTHRAQIGDLAIRHRLPWIGAFRDYPEAGALMSYGTDWDDLIRRSASYVDRILKGADPATMPVQQAEKFQLVINLKTAKALGLTIPPSVLARADEIIE